MRVLDLFSGIGGFSLGLERAGMKTIAFCEIDKFCQKVLKKHWPDVPVHEDITKLDGNQYAGTVDLICGGFPCQDISIAGKGVGIEGEKSGLWKEYARIISEIKPRWILVENVARLLSKGIDVVLSDLASLGYNAEWHCIPASAIGAPHQRDRVWIIAYPKGEQDRWIQQPKSQSDIDNEINTHTNGERLQGGKFVSQKRIIERLPEKQLWGSLPTPYVCRGSDGISDRTHRLKALGNAVVPQIPEILGKCIMEIENN